jgi:hypothetical protein
MPTDQPTPLTVTADHLALLERMTFDWDDDIEYGGVASDFKRPYGNSDVETDVAEILGRDVDSAEAKRLTMELAAVVNHLVHNGVSYKWVAVGDQLPHPWRAFRALRNL